MIHPSEEEIAAYVSDVSDAGRGDLREHVDGCPQCRDAASEYGEIIDSLSSRKTWGIEDSHSATLESISRFDARWQSDTREAASLMAGLKDVPADQWPLEEFPRTPVMILEILKEYRIEVVKNPAHALRIADFAEDLAKEIREGSHSNDTILQVRGKIAKEKSLALRYLGRFDRALASLEEAYFLFSQLELPDFDLATVAYNRAAIYGETDRYDEGIQLLDVVEATFSHFGINLRVAHCRLVRGGLLYYRGSIEAARDEFATVLEYADLDQATLSDALVNLACCHLKLGDFESATELSSRAEKLFVNSGNPVAAVRARWAVARARLGSGLETEGLSLLRAVAMEYRELGMITDWALVLLDIVKFLLPRRDHDEVLRLCTIALEQFLSAGMPAAAAEAMANLRDLAARGEMTSKDIGEVHALISRRPSHFSRSLNLNRRLPASTRFHTVS